MVCQAEPDPADCVPRSSTVRDALPAAAATAIRHDLRMFGRPRVAPAPSVSPQMCHRPWHRPASSRPLTRRRCRTVSSTSPAATAAHRYVHRAPPSTRTTLTGCCARAWPAVKASRTPWRRISRYSSPSPHRSFGVVHARVVTQHTVAIARVASADRSPATSAATPANAIMAGLPSASSVTRRRTSAGRAPVFGLLRPQPPGRLEPVRLRTAVQPDNATGSMSR
jgi:hypothetical protein